MSTRSKSYLFLSILLIASFCPPAESTSKPSSRKYSLNYLQYLYHLQQLISLASFLSLKFRDFSQRPKSPFFHRFLLSYLYGNSLMLRKTYLFIIAKSVEFTVPLTFTSAASLLIFSTKPNKYLFNNATSLEFTLPSPFTSPYVTVSVAVQLLLSEKELRWETE